MNNSLVLLAQGLTKSFYQNATEVPVLKGVNLQLALGEHLACDAPQPMRMVFH